MNKTFFFWFYLIIGVLGFLGSISALQLVGNDGTVTDATGTYVLTRGIEFKDFFYVLTLIESGIFILIAFLIKLTKVFLTKLLLLVVTFVLIFPFWGYLISLIIDTQIKSSSYRCQGLAAVECLSDTIAGLLVIFLIGVNIFVFFRISRVNESKRFVDKSA